jgi:hypothetical protein
MSNAHLDTAGEKPTYEPDTSCMRSSHAIGIHDRRPPGLGRLSAHGPEYDVSDRLSFVCSRTTRSASNVLFPTWQRKRNATVARGNAV